MIIGYAKDDKRIKRYVDKFLENGDISIEQLYSTVGRTATRAIETN